jgi:hypothetical protein
MTGIGLLDKWQVMGRLCADKRISRGAEVQVAWVLLNHHNTTSGRCDPAIETILSQICASRRGVIRALNNLEAWGYFSRSRRGWHRSNSYSPILQSEVPQAAPQDGSEVPQVARENGSEVPQAALREVPQAAPKHIKKNTVREDEHGKEIAACTIRATEGLASEPGKVISLHAGSRVARRKPEPKPWHVDSGATKATYAPDAAELAYLRGEFPLASSSVDLELGKWRRYEHRKPPKNLRDSFRNWMANKEEYARERNSAPQPRQDVDSLGLPRSSLSDLGKSTDELYRRWGVDN